ncbi:MAG: hypothetical protein JW909_06990 [Planctomycetes bacterium]|nr:hypothetical protein [Planctomycetota bacterium]
MSKHENSECNRRELLAGLWRALAASALGLLAWILTAGRRSRPEQRCSNRGLCCNCDSFDDCTLPQALSARRAGRR